MHVETDAIVISSLKYRDSSLIVRCYCKELGLRSFMLKGILAAKKRAVYYTVKFENFLSVVIVMLASIGILRTVLQAIS